MSENTFLFQGAGEAAIGIAELLVSAIQKEGVSLDKARQRIWLVDSKGLVVKDRKAGGISEHKAPFAKKHKEISSLQVAVETLKPTAIIGASAQPGSFTKEILQVMGKNHKTPIIFALSNPTAKAECTAEAAYQATEGRCVFASGSPFPSIEINGKQKVPGQGNNAYIFPGIGLATVAVQIRCIDDDLFLRSAEELASFVTEEDLKVGRVYPALSRIREVSIEIACRIAKYAYDRGCAGYYPKSDDINKFVKDQVYDTRYDRVLPDVYPWPSETKFYCA